MQRLTALIVMATAAFTTTVAAVDSAAADRAFHVMVANDDGITAAGLEALVAVLAADPAYRVTVVAPTVQHSGSGHALVIRGEIAVHRQPPIHGVTAWAVEATPATTVRIGIGTMLAEDPPDLVVSGINRGENVGRAPWYSGTVGAAREAVIAGVPAVAFSLALDWSDPRPDWPAAARWAKPVVDAIRRHGLPEQTLLNVNIPRDPSAARGYRLARMGLAPDAVSRYDVVRRDGDTLWVKSVWSPPVESLRGTDTVALADGWVTLVPLGLDQTDLGALAALQDLELACDAPPTAVDATPAR
jgi:5'-nucleotidase